MCKMAVMVMMVMMMRVVVVQGGGGFRPFINFLVRHELAAPRVVLRSNVQLSGILVV
jgi:hypothetical protein